ncbi:hypothetical protein DPMN_047756 [Dreissena polymorpha]|uniref:Uncharacterized protein n=1 Tax=Dreissena polymorpha TaxID=45954 RepID=A0A9D4I1S1_DREPO|nr:hypothetical protein DPMN_047756 [Dreissena polymorpha]
MLANNYQETLFNQIDDDEDNGIFNNRADGTRSRVSSEEECTKKMMQLFDSYDIFGVHEEENRLFSIASKDIVTNDIRDVLLTCESRGKTLLKEFVEKRLKEQNVECYAPIEKVQSKTFAYLYKETVNEKQKVTKILKADRKLMQGPFNATNSGRAVETASVLEHELSDVLLSFAKASVEMHETQKSNYSKGLQRTMI